MTAQKTSEHGTLLLFADFIMALLVPNFIPTLCGLGCSIPATA